MRPSARFKIASLKDTVKFPAMVSRRRRANSRQNTTQMPRSRAANAHPSQAETFAVMMLEKLESGDPSCFRKEV